MKILENIRIKCLSLCLLYCYTVTTQTVSLKDLDSFSFSYNNDSIENVLKPYGFSFASARATKLNNSVQNIVAYQNTDYEINSKEYISVFRDTAQLKKLFPIVTFFTFSEKKYRSIKSQIDLLKILRQGEYVDGIKYYRWYRTVSHTYTICNYRHSNGLTAYEIETEYTLISKF